ncbi:MAG TPA: DUF1684 domain-containing protein [Candidatus Polarisedimenticolia bacterium]|nr:DUF1684 domain-containing protein [Candidatus Polarisedimenticolia bacterium]
MRRLIAALSLLLTAAQPLRAAQGESGAADPESLQTRIAAERRLKNDWFRDHPWSPLRAFARHDYSAENPAPAILGSAAGATVPLPDEAIAPRHLSIAVLPPAAEQAWRFRVENLGPAGTVAIDGIPLEQGADDGRVRIVMEEAVIEIGPYAVRPYVQGGAGILILFDSRRTAPDRFDPPRYFDVDPAFQFRAPLIRAAEPELIALETSLGRTKEYRRIGHFELRIGGADVRVHAYEPAFVSSAGELLTLLFTDATTGKESYGTGRYLDLDPPTDGLYLIDFNRAYNPYCSYTDAYNCPIPPRENRLAVAIRAGEKSYPH